VNVSKWKENSEQPESPAKVMERLIQFLVSHDDSAEAHSPSDSSSGISSQDYWKLGHPEIVFHITGTASPLRQGSQSDPDLSDVVPGWFFFRMKEFITSVLFDIAFAQNGPVWMFDGGTDYGIMKLVGNLHKEVFSRISGYPRHFVHGRKWHSTFPLIGVSELAKIDYAELAEYPEGREDGAFRVMANCEDKGNGWKPNKEHTHHLFLHMKDFKCSESPHDGPVLSRLFVNLSTKFKCPIVRSHRAFGLHLTSLLLFQGSLRLRRRQ
jgi:hypothetical protein